MTTPRNSAPDTWVAIDFETATREANSACALGLAIVRDGRVERTESWLIQPPFNEYEYRNMLDPRHLRRGHRARARLRRGLVGGRAAPRRRARFSRTTRRSTSACCARSSRVTSSSRRSYEYVCTVSPCSAGVSELRRHTLDTMCDHCGITLMHHDAASDAAACANLALACADAAGASSITEAVEVLGVKVGRL